MDSATDRNFSLLTLRICSATAFLVRNAIMITEIYDFGSSDSADHTQQKIIDIKYFLSKLTLLFITLPLISIDFVS